MTEAIPKRLSAAILNSLSAGVVPRTGLEYVAVGRKREIETILRDLESVGEGAAAFRFIVGRYGSGKSFFLQAIRNYAMDNNFLVADVDLSPEKRLAGSSGAGLATYRELMQRLSAKLRPEGGALEGMLQKWINSIKLELIKDGASPQDEDLPSRVERRIFETVNEMEELTHGFDFAAVVSAYYRFYVNADDEGKKAALKWLRGEFSSKTEARKFLPVGEIIADENWYEYAKLIAAFGFRIGYRGLLLFIDEGVNLCKIANRQSRENNYEKLLAMFNDVMQGKAERLGIYVAGTPQFVEDERRGLFSYAALKSRLGDSRFVRDGYTDFGSPILHLARLSHEEIYILLERLRDIHAVHYGYEAQLGQRELAAFMELTFSTPGAEEFITPREITRDFIGLLNIIHEESGVDFDTLVYRDGYRVKGFASGGSGGNSTDAGGESDGYASFDL
ncbi:biotin carboxylase [Spirochaetia bacterium]|nr:biotin carboxylase [Spirochaetia bacterium]